MSKISTANGSETYAMRSDPHASIRAYATLRFAGDRLDPAAISDIVQVGPTLSYRKGERYLLGRREVERIGKSGYWFLSTKSHVASDKLPEHERFVLDRMGAIDASSSASETFHTLSQLVTRYDLTCLVTLFWFGREGATPPRVDPRLTSAIRALNGAIETDFNVPSGEAGRKLLHA